VLWLDAALSLALSNKSCWIKDNNNNCSRCSSSGASRCDTFLE
jgi:hypothetical protein